MVVPAAGTRTVSLLERTCPGLQRVKKLSLRVKFYQNTLYCKNVRPLMFQPIYLVSQNSKIFLRYIFGPLKVMRIYLTCFYDENVILDIWTRTG